MDPNFDSPIAHGRGTAPLTDGNFTFGDFALLFAQGICVLGAGIAVGAAVVSLFTWNGLTRLCMRHCHS